MKPLNPHLYKQLKHVFSHVEISSQGVDAQIRYTHDWGREGRIQANVVDGEYYRVNCPFCNDTRNRLFIHYRWGEYDDRTGYRLLHIANCFNEQCIDSYEKQKALLSLVYPHGVAFHATPLPRQTQQPKPNPPACMPQNCVPINLPNHDYDVPDEALQEAQDYLIERGFDLDELQSRWNISYTSESQEPAPKIFHRIVIPVTGIRTRLGKPGPQPYLAGWQAREVCPELRPALFPKYMNSQGFKKSQVLYGLPQALKATGPVVITEGVTDVWRLGGNAVALFGKSLSDAQRRLLLKHFGSRPLVIFLDDDAQSEAAALQASLREGRLCRDDSGRVVVATLPQGRADIGECLREEAWECVADALGPELIAREAKFPPQE